MEDSTTESTRISVDHKIDSFVEGDLEHATEMLSALWEIANKEGDVKAPSITAPTVSFPGLRSSTSNTGTFMFQITKPTSPGHWNLVKVALIKSIREGVFFDRKYWVRHAKAGHALKPIYFSSTIMNDRAEQLNKRTSIFCCGFD